jgi:hypothetical protein
MFKNPLFFIEVFEKRGSGSESHRRAMREEERGRRSFFLKKVLLPLSSYSPCSVKNYFLSKTLDLRVKVLYNSKNDI